jgi:hypothetical protein
MENISTLTQLETRRSLLVRAKCDLVAFKTANGEIESVSNEDLILSTQMILSELQPGLDTSHMNADGLIAAATEYFKKTTEGN